MNQPAASQVNLHALPASQSDTATLRRRLLEVLLAPAEPDSISYYEYAQGGVLEYWLLDPQRRWAEFYHLEDDHYRLAYAGAAGDYPCALLPGFRLRVGWLWQQPLPRVLDVIRELGLL